MRGAGRGVWLGPVTLVLVIGLVTLRARQAGAGLAYEDDMFETAGRLVGALFVVAAFLERALAVLNGLLFGLELRQREAAALATGFFGGTAEAVAEIEGWRERVRLVIGFVFAVLISAAGVRTLESLVTPPDGGGQEALFHAVDIVLTAGLLAGGSNALGFLADLIRGQTGETLARLRATTLERHVSAERTQTGRRLRSRVYSTDSERGRRDA